MKNRKSKKVSMPQIRSFRINPTKGPLSSRESIIHLPDPFNTINNPWLSIKNHILRKKSNDFSKKTLRKFFDISPKKSNADLEWENHPLNHKITSKFPVENSEEFLFLSKSAKKEKGRFKIDELVTLAMDKKNNDRLNNNRRITKKVMKHDLKILDKKFKRAGDNWEIFDKDYEPFYKKLPKKEEISIVKEQNLLRESDPHNPHIDEEITRAVSYLEKTRKKFFLSQRSKSFEHQNIIYVADINNAEFDHHKEEESFLPLKFKKIEKLTTNMTVSSTENEELKKFIKRTKKKKRTLEKERMGKKKIKEENTVFNSISDLKSNFNHLGYEDDYTTKLYSIDHITDDEFLNLTMDIIMNLKKTQRQNFFRSKTYSEFGEILFKDVKIDLGLRQGKRKRKKIGMIDFDTQGQLEVLYSIFVKEKISGIKKVRNKKWIDEIKQRGGVFEIPWYLNKKKLKIKLGLLKLLIRNVALRTQIFGVRESVHLARRKNFRSRNNVLRTESCKITQSFIDVDKYKKILKICLETKFKLLKSETEVKQKQQYIKNQFEALNSPRNNSSKHLSDFKKAMMIFLKIAKEGNLKDKSPDEIGSIISKIMSDRKRRNNLRKTRRRRIITRMTNKLTLLQNFVFNIIKENENLTYNEIELDSETVKGLRELLVINDNEENLRKLVEEKKQKLLEEKMKNEKEKEEEKKRIQSKKKLTSKKEMSAEFKLKSLYKNKLKPMMYLFPDFLFSGYQKSRTIDKGRRKSNRKGFRSHTVQNISKFGFNKNFLAKEKSDERGRKSSRKSNFTKTLASLEIVEDDHEESTDSIKKKVKEFYKKIQTETEFHECIKNLKADDFISKLSEQMISPELMRSRKKMRKKISKERLSSRKKLKHVNPFIKSTFVTQFVGKEKLTEDKSFRKKRKKIFEYEKSNLRGETKALRNLSQIAKREKKIMSYRSKKKNVKKFKSKKKNVKKFKSKTTRCLRINTKV